MPSAWPEEALFKSSTVNRAHSTSFTFDPPTHAKCPDDSTPILPSPVPRYTWLDRSCIPPFLQGSSEGDERGANSVEGPTHYHPEDAAPRAAAMVHEDKRKQWRESEELRRVQIAPDKQFDRDDETRLWLLEEMLSKDVKRAICGRDRTLRLPVEIEERRRGGLERDRPMKDAFWMGKGTPGHEGHRSLQQYFGNMAKKRKSEVLDVDGEETGEEAGEETGKEKGGQTGEQTRRNRQRKVPRGILKTRRRKTRSMLGGTE